MPEDLDPFLESEPLPGDTAFGRVTLGCVAKAPGDAARPPRTPKGERCDVREAASRIALWTSLFEELKLDVGEI